MPLVEEDFLRDNRRAVLENTLVSVIVGSVALSNVLVSLAVKHKK